MFTFGSDGQPKYKFTGSELCFGETDGSSYPNGGLRATHTAGGYTIIDATSPIFMREDTIYIPTIFASWTGFALDEKIPLLRSCEALSKEGVRFLSKFGHTASAVQPNIGLEQEFFFVPRDLYAKRLDLVMSGRTVMGKDPPRGQEMCDHYMGPPNQHAMECIREIQKEAFLMGIPLKTRHREVAPNQYEFAPYFGFVTTQIDQNLMVMQIAEEVAARYNLAVLLQEKPFNGVNGSGKHNNWSIGTPEGLNLFNAGQVADTLKSKDAFPAIMACIVQGVNRHGDLMRAAIANPGNDFRLGACEAPPAIISTYLGDSLTEYLKAYMEGSDAEYKPEKRPLDTGISFIPSFSVPSEDRNRTSPFPYGGHRFEFRAVGSAQNVSLVNVVLNALTTEAMKEFSDKVDAGQSIKDVAIAMLKENFKAVFNGNGYAESWKDEAVSRGIWRIDSGVEALEHLTSDKNKAMFKSLNILGEEELTAKRDVHLDHYTNTVEIECLAMIDMMQQQVIPAIKEAKMATGDLEAGVKKLQEGIKGVHAGADCIAKARLARVLRLETMVAVRETCDTAEATCPAHLWPMPNYTQLLFLDQTQDAFGNTIAMK
jgi:glutamine synthetase